MARKPETGRSGAVSQSQRFIETARALGCDEDEAAFRDKLRVIARQKPKTEPKHEPKHEPKRTKAVPNKPGWSRP